MFIYCLITITLLYYLVLWRVTAKKTALERAAREAFGPVTGIQDLLASADHQSNSRQLIEQPPSSSKEDIFGAITNIQELTTTTMSKQSIINAVSFESTIPDSPLPTDPVVVHQGGISETVLEAKLRHSIFAGSSLAKDSTNCAVQAGNLSIKNTIDAISEKVLEAELEAVVDELEESIPPITPPSPTNNTLPMDTLQKSDLVHQLNKLFDKDYQDYV